MSRKILLTVVIVLLAVSGVDYLRISRYNTYPQKPDPEIKLNEHQFYFDLANGKTLMGGIWTFTSFCSG